VKGGGRERENRDEEAKGDCVECVWSDGERVCVCVCVCVCVVGLRVCVTFSLRVRNHCICEHCMEFFSFSDMCLVCVCVVMWCVCDVCVW